MQPQGVPGPVESAWAPDPETIRRLELALGPVLQEGLKLMPERQANDYYRQYAGAVIGGERIVYINGFYGGMLEAARRSPDANRFTPALEWRTTAIGVQPSDGGSNYFGAEYIADVDIIRHLRFDGAATIAPRSIDPAAIPGSIDPNRIRKGHGK